MKSAPFIRSAIALAVVSLFAGCSQWNDLVRGNQSSTVGSAPAARSGTIVVGEPAGTSRSSVVVSEPASSSGMAAARPSEPTATGTATATSATSAARNTTNSGNNEIGTAATSPTYGGGTPRSAIAAAEAAGQTSTAMNTPPATAQIAPPATSQPSRQMVSDVRSAQQALKDDGYNVGPIDGKMGPKTSAALRKFQKDHGIQATGRLDSQTMAALGSSTGSTS